MCKIGGKGSSPEAHLARMVFRVRFMVRVRVRVRPFSRSREVRFWTRPGGKLVLMTNRKSYMSLMYFP